MTLGRKPLGPPTCHPDRPYQAKGMCSQCYHKARYAERPKRKDPSEYAPNYRKPPHPPQRNASCHPDRPHKAKDLCESCYVKQWENAAKAICHPEKPHLANGLCAGCHSKRRYQLSPEVGRRLARESGARVRARARDELIEAYGGRCACARCPETNPAFLCLDHINGDGKAHRMKVGSHTYTDLRRQGFPKEGYRLLCWNCNAAVRFGRTCPHELEEA